MHPDELEIDRPILPYQPVAPPAAKPMAGTLALFSAFCVVAPVLGFTIRNGPLFLLGLPLSLFGVVLGVAAMIAGEKAPIAAGFGFLATAVNGVSASYFVWLFFVRVFW